jgi:aromatic-L-amino-acid decarboxylase
MDPALGDVPVEHFRAEAHRLVDWIAAYLEGAEKYPVLSRSSPGAIRAALPGEAPREGEPLATIVEDAERLLLPGLTHWNHPGFFAYFANSSTAPGILGELLAAAWNQNAMLWRTSPAATELESLTLDWFRTMLGLPAGLFGVIQDTASSSTLVALAAAREAVPGLEVRERGLVGQARLRLYASAHAHSSVEKAGLVLGVGREGFRAVPVDRDFRMDPGALAAAILEDRARGLTPFAVVATVGTTSTTSIDPVGRIADIAAAQGLWLHVDAAYGGSAAVDPAMRHVLDGCDRADSIVINPHKWLFVPMDLSVLYTRRPETMKAAFSLVPEYLRTAEDVPNLMDYGVSLGRRFRALKFWMVLRAFGSEGLARRIRAHVALAARFRSWLEGDPRFEVVAPSPFSTVCFRIRCAGAAPKDEDLRNERAMERVNASGEVFLSHTSLAGRFTLRLAIGNIRTDERHVRRAYDLLGEAAEGA